jgi:hypothetical protein
MRLDYHIDIYDCIQEQGQTAREREREGLVTEMRR